MEHENDTASVLRQIRAPLYITRGWRMMEDWVAASDIDTVVKEMVEAELRASWERMLHRGWFKGYLN